MAQVGRVVSPLRVGRPLRSATSCLGPCTDDGAEWQPAVGVLRSFPVGIADERDAARARPRNARLSQTVESERVGKCCHERRDQSVRNTNRATDSSLAKPSRRAIVTGNETGYEHEHRDATPRAPSLSSPGRTVKSFSRLLRIVHAANWPQVIRPAGSRSTATATINSKSNSFGRGSDG